MTKPAQLLSRANRVLADDTNEPAVVDVTNFIQPVVDVLRLDTDLFVLSFNHVMAAALTLIFRVGPVPRAEVWDFLELGMSGTGAGPFQWQTQLEWDTPLGLRRLLVNEATTESGGPIDLLRASNNVGGAGPSHISDRSLLVYPGMTLAIHGLTAQAIGDLTRFDFTFKKSVANAPLFQINDNANVVVTEV